MATEKKVYIGKGKKYFSKISVGEFVVETEKLKLETPSLLQAQILEL